MARTKRRIGNIGRDGVVEEEWTETYDYKVKVGDTTYWFDEQFINPDGKMGILRQVHDGPEHHSSSGYTYPEVHKELNSFLKLNWDLVERVTGTPEGKHVSIIECDYS